MRSELEVVKPGRSLSKGLAALLGTVGGCSVLFWLGVEREGVERVVVGRELERVIRGRRGRCFWAG
jgi:hypothetical protein